VNGEFTSSYGIRARNGRIKVKNINQIAEKKKLYPET
jgi:hypothetical protein